MGLYKQVSGPGKTCAIARGVNASLSRLVIYRGIAQKLPLSQWSIGPRFGKNIPGTNFTQRAFSLGPLRRLTNCTKLVEGSLKDSSTADKVFPLESSSLVSPLTLLGGISRFHLGRVDWLGIIVWHTSRSSARFSTRPH